jgi:hypothetical protein
LSHRETATGVKIFFFDKPIALSTEVVVFSKPFRAASRPDLH